MKSKPVLVIENVAKQYGSVAAVRNVSVTVNQGEIYGFVGLNGAGKTTTIRMLLGMIAPTAGHIEIFGEPVDGGHSNSAIWRRVGQMVEGPSIYPELTVRENLAVTCKLQRIKDIRVLDNIIERLHLTPYEHRKAGNLSLGNKQRLGLAKALVHKPDLLILDEPTNGLDPIGVVETRNLLSSLAAEGTTIFVSSHILTEISVLASRVGIIHKGRIINETTAAELTKLEKATLVVDARDKQGAADTLGKAGFEVHMRTGGVMALMSKSAVDRPDDIARLLVEAGNPPTRLSIERESLEDYFLRLIQNSEQPEGDTK